ncbi:hypothetical protein C8R43DRAFT_965154 [Mycena crocata]|nr:hypothetical protein C8R43DRAFT_965154 [Mycena crocata]
MALYSVDAPTVPDKGRILGHIRSGREICTVYKGDAKFVRHLPVIDRVPMPNPGRLNGHFHTPTVVNPATAYMIFIPARDPFFGPTFGILDYTKKSLPVIQVNSEEWELDPDVQRSWEDTEDSVRVTIRILMELSNLPRPVPMSQFAAPYRYGYTRRYKSENAARVVAWRSRNGFLPLMGHLSMFLWYMSIEDPLNWRDELNKRATFPPQWLTNLEKSVLTDWEFPRIGGLINLVPPPGERGRMTELDYLMGSIINWNLPIPLYMYWGSLETDPTIPVPTCLTQMGQFYPDWREIQYLLQLPGKIAYSRWQREDFQDQWPLFTSCREWDPYIAPISPYIAPMPTFAVEDAGEAPTPTPVPAPAPAPAPSPATAPPAPFPPVEAGSGQRTGESFDANAQRKLTESEQAKRSREAREVHAAKGAVPGTKGARVFVWEEVDGHLIRRAAGRSHYDDYWDEFAPEQRRFDSFHNEWDLCAEFAPDAEPPADWEDDDDDENDGNVPENLFPEREEPTVAQASAASERALDRAYSLVPNEVYAPHQIEPPHDYAELADSCERMAYFRYGYSIPTSRVEPGVPVDASTVPPVALIEKLVGKAKIMPTTESAKHNLGLFFSQCRTGKVSTDVSREFYDFHDPSSDIYSDWPINGWGPGVSVVAGRLLSRGIPFRLCLHEKRIQPPPCLPMKNNGIKRVNVFSGLGYRPKDYKPDLRDYKGYVALRSNFLRTPRGRAALQYGGIVGRLARFEVPDDEVIVGPTNSVFITGACWRDGENMGSFCDDELTADEIDLICGVYHISTGQCDSGSSNIDEQTSTQSWWPKPAAFEISDMNVGWWSPLCEEWFQKRLQQIASGTATLPTHARWKHNLKRDRKFPIYMKGLEQQAALAVASFRP